MATTYSPNSRYYGLAIRTATRPDGTVDSYVARRIIADTARYVPLDRHRTVGGERIDTVSANSYGDPELYWRICDGNGDAEPGDATLPVGRLLIIPMPLEVASNGQS